MNSVKEMVKDGKKANFVYFRHNQLWYKTECGFLFAVPISDIGDATFESEEKAMMLMRYIRKQIDANAEGQKDSMGM